jgi:hypothetical protein
MESKVLPIVQVKQVCKHGQNQKQCRYLAEDSRKISVFYCLKTQKEKNIIDEEMAKWLESKKTIPPDNTMPLGDNCQGYLSHL